MDRMPGLEYNAHAYKLNPHGSCRTKDSGSRRVSGMISKGNSCMTPIYETALGRQHLFTSSS